MRKTEHRDRELLFRLTRKDFVVEAYTGHGKGGQNRNRRRTACRITHPPSGAVGWSQDQRKYKQNERTAFRRLVESDKFKAWHKLEVCRRLGLMAQAEEEAERQMRPENLLVEVKGDDGTWTKEVSEQE
jgi:protein subunit release factor B